MLFCTDNCFLSFVQSIQGWQVHGWPAAVFRASRDLDNSWATHYICLASTKSTLSEQHVHALSAVAITWSPVGASARSLSVDRKLQPAPKEAQVCVSPNFRGGNGWYDCDCMQASSTLLNSSWQVPAAQPMWALNLPSMIAKPSCASGSARSCCRVLWAGGAMPFWSSDVPFGGMYIRPKCKLFPPVCCMCFYQLLNHMMDPGTEKLQSSDLDAIASLTFQATTPEPLHAHPLESSLQTEACGPWNDRCLHFREHPCSCQRQDVVSSGLRLEDMIMDERPGTFQNQCSIPSGLCLEDMHHG